MPVTTSFESHCLDVPLIDITPLRPVTPAVRATAKYRQIATSLQEIGLVEPLVVFPGTNRTYLLLDGHIRFDVLRMRQAVTARCIIANDDEAHTYNKRVNRLSTIEEHRMILKAIDQGVTESRIAAVLRINVATIRKKRDLLDGICPETAALLRDKHMTASAFKVLSQMKPTRQFEAAEIMIAANRYTFPFAKALLAGTPTSLLNAPERPHAKNRLATEQKAMLENEIGVIIRDLRDIEETYASNIFDFTLGCRYLERVLANPRVYYYIANRYPDLLRELDEIVHQVQVERTAAANTVATQGFVV